MTPREIQFVQESMPHVLAAGDAFTGAFYTRLFALDPGLKFLFAPYMGERQKILLDQLHKLVRSLDRPHRLLPALRYLGQQHAYYGVRPADYELVQQALLVALAHTLQERFTDQVREAWSAAFRLMAQTMKEAAEQVESTLGF
ncbi:MAG: globin domain-containing protein [Chloroflexota bacterium]